MIASTAAGSFVLVKTIEQIFALEVVYARDVTGKNGLPDFVDATGCASLTARSQSTCLVTGLPSNADLIFAVQERCFDGLFPMHSAMSEPSDPIRTDARRAAVAVEAARVMPLPDKPDAIAVRFTQSELHDCEFESYMVIASPAFTDTFRTVPLARTK